MLDAMGPLGVSWNKLETNIMCDVNELLTLVEKTVVVIGQKHILIITEGWEFYP